ncbi:uncharacterized protein LACBIDRAFT_296882 [Laccaria bicolor S238N-H82]|uniref:Predicted protein n=1 Tax=Laccaria bicolor (strain S238N-H82 / ATCC MYA-4686) TaxID=486041 RepID=B0D9H3_LACBS|nr:uncharacterized protein LACBIDRAFT_296882 [Laccaria bicolor S238N-H82]EDR08352.1 predicted protein [Laccaria bicolor S238N-H82]|eukprot:XP_001880577.1 predicted protein [Laccaria bicolor S238N-H82]
MARTKTRYLALKEPQKQLGHAQRMSGVEKIGTADMSENLSTHMDPPQHPEDARGQIPRVTKNNGIHHNNAINRHLLVRGQPNQIADSQYSAVNPAEMLDKGSVST